MPRARNLLQRMRRTPWGFTAQQVRQVYAYLGFEIREGGEHTVYVHPDFPQLIATVKRSSGSLPPGYIRRLIQVADSLQELKREAL